MPEKLILLTVKLTKDFKHLRRYKTGREEEIGGVRNILGCMHFVMQYLLFLVKVGLEEKTVNTSNLYLNTPFIQHMKLRSHNKYQFRLVHHTDITSSTLWMKSHNSTASVIIRLTLKNFNSHVFNNYSFLDYIHIS